MKHGRYVFAGFFFSLFMASRVADADLSSGVDVSLRLPALRLDLPCIIVTTPTTNDQITEISRLLLFALQQYNTACIVYFTMWLNNLVDSAKGSNTTSVFDTNGCDGRDNDLQVKALAGDEDARVKLITALTTAIQYLQGQLSLVPGPEPSPIIATQLLPWCRQLLRSLTSESSPER